MPKTLTHVGIFLLTLAACLWATVSISRGPIERDLTHRSEEALAEIEGLRPEYCQIQFVGRDGLLTGEVQTVAAKAAAEEELRELHGVRVIESSLTVRPFDRPWLELVQGESLRAKGLLATEAEMRRVRNAIRSAIGDSELKMEIEVREKVEEAEWLADTLPIAKSLLGQADDATLKLRDGKLALSGEMPDDASKEEFVAMAESWFSEAQMILSVAPPPEPSYFELKPEKDGKIVVSGRVADLASSKKLLEVLRATEFIIEDQILVAENTLEAPWLDGLLFLLPGMLNDVISAAIKIDGQTVSLGGQLESEEMFESIGDLALQNFPSPAFDVENRMSVMAPPREAMVSIITSADGDQIQLKGVIGNEDLKERIVAAVRSSVPDSELLTEDLRVEENVMSADWIDALVELIPPYTKQVKSGGLTINSNILVVEAVIESDRDRDLIWAMTEHHFPDDKYRRFLELRFPEEVEGRLAADEDDIDLDR